MPNMHKICLICIKYACNMHNMRRIPQPKTKHFAALISKSHFEKSV